MKIKAIFYLKLFFCFLLVSGPSFEAWALPLPAGARSKMASSGIVGQQLIDAFDAFDKARVIIAFDVPNAKHTKLPDQALINSRGKAILDNFSPGEFKARPRLQSVSALAGEINAAGVLGLLNNPHIIRVDLDAGGRGTLAQSVPQMNLDYVQGAGYGGAGVVVAVIDSGIDTNHPDLSDNLIYEHCICFTGGGCCPNATGAQTGPGAAEDDHGHGTHVSGIITSKGDVAALGGAPEAGIIAIKVLDSANSFSSAYDIVAALDWIINNRPDVDIVSMSLGTFARFTGDCDTTYAWTIALAQAIDTLRANGVPAFVSSGNAGDGTAMEAPACVAGALSVGAVYDANLGSRGWGVCTDATTNQDKVVCFTNDNDKTDMFAPGSIITSTAIGGGFTNMSGTSMAAPACSACASLLLEKNPGQTVDKLEALMESSPVQVTDAKNGLSFPRVDCGDAYDKLLGLSGPASFTFSCEQGTPAPASDSLDITNAGAVPWTITSAATWLIFGATAGVGNTAVTVAVDCAGVSSGDYNVDINITTPYGAITPAAIPLTLIVDPDSDSDGLSDFDEINIHLTNPNNPDTDGDGVNDGDEYNTYNTDPTYWDSDLDLLPDGFEINNASGHSANENLDPLDPADGGTDFDGDSIENYHEYWNNSDPWTWNPRCGEGCYCWGDAGAGDGVPDPTDIVELGKAVRGLGPDYTNVLPASGMGQDLDGDSTLSPLDITELKKMVRGLDIPVLGSRPGTLVVLENPGSTVKVGDTCHVTIGVLNAPANYSPAFGVVFKIGAGSVGSAEILGGEGESGQGRYDVSEDAGTSRVFLKILSGGTIEVEAGLPGCGVATIGRYCPLINAPVVEIIGE